MNPRTPMAGGSRGHLPSIAAYLRIHLPINSRAGNAASPLKKKPSGASLIVLATCGKQKAHRGEAQGKGEGRLDQDMASHSPLFTGPSLLCLLRSHPFFLFAPF